MRKARYLKLLMAQSDDWLRASASNPTPHMTPVHVWLHYVALRRKASRA